MIIRKMTENDRNDVLAMMRVFYASPAVISDGSEAIFTADFDACVGDSPYVEGYLFEEQGQILGYAMIARSFSTEFGKPCVWIEDIYVKEAYRGQGVGSRFFEFIEQANQGVLFMLEVERDNARAIRVYEKCGYSELPYMEMKKHSALSVPS